MKSKHRGLFLDTTDGNTFTTSNGQEYTSINGTIYKRPKESTKKLTPSKLSRKAERSARLRTMQEERRLKKFNNEVI